MQEQDIVISVRTQPTVPGKTARIGARIGVEITDTMATLEWMIPQVTDTVNSFLVGDDGHIAYYRVRHKNFHGKVFEFGEQVLATPKRSNKQVKKKGALEPGYNDRSNEHNRGSERRRSSNQGQDIEGERCSATAIKDIVADMPSPKDPRSERKTRGLDFGASRWQFLARQGVRHVLGLNRNLRSHNRVLEMYGPTNGM